MVAKSIRHVRRSGRPVRIRPSGEIEVILGPVNDYLHEPLLAVDVRKSTNGVEYHLWGSGGTLIVSGGSPSYRAGYGASVVGFSKENLVTVSVGDPGPSSSTTEVGEFGEGKGGGGVGAGGGGTGIRNRNGTLIAVAGGGGGAWHQNFERFTRNGGDAGIISNGAGEGGYRGRTHEGALFDQADNGGADFGGDGQDTSFAGALSGGGGGAGADGSGGGGGGTRGADGGLGFNVGGPGGTGGGNGTDGSPVGHDHRGRGGKGKNDAISPGDGGPGGHGGGGGYGGGGGSGVYYAGGASGSSLAPSGWTLGRADDDADPDRDNAGDPDNEGGAKISY